jgi:peptide/nickel transport system substrate-binding protein
MFAIRASRWIGLVLVTILVLSLVGCGGTATPTAAPKATVATGPTTAPSSGSSANPFVIVMDFNDILTLDPGIAFEQTFIFFLNAAYDTLVTTEAPEFAKYVGRAADSWTVSTDGLVWTFHIRPGIKFRSGNPLTAEDARFTWQRDINLKNSVSENLNMVAKVEAPDASTFVVTLKYPSAPFLSAAAIPSMSIVDSKVVKAKGGTDAADADKSDTARAWLDQNSEGSGEYIITSWKPKQEIVLEANPNYWGPKPKSAKIVVKGMTDPSTALQMLQKGDADLVYALDIDLLSKVKADATLKANMVQTFNYEYIEMTFNPDLSKPLSDVRVRKALIAAIDYDGIINGILGGNGARAPSLLPLGFIGVDPKLVKGRDVALAKSLLKDAGYASGFSVDMAYGQTALRDTVAAKVKSDLAEVGVTLNLKPMETPVFLSDYYAGKLQMQMRTTVTDRVDPVNWTAYMCCKSGISWRMWYYNPDNERLEKVIESEIDPVKRAQAVADIQANWVNDGYGTMLWQHQLLVATRAAVTGFVWHPFRLADFGKLGK